MRLVLGIQLAVLAGGCSSVLDLGSLGGGFEDANATFIQSAEYSIDTTGDGQGDVTVHGLAAVITDRGDLCNAPGSDLDNFEDAVALTIEVLWVGELEAIENSADRLSILSFPAEGDAFVGVSAVERAGGAFVSRTATLNLVDPTAVIDASFRIGAREDGDDGVESLSADFEAVLGADLSDPSSFDSDVGGDGTDDYTAIEETISGSVEGAVPCSRLGVLP